MTLPYFLSEISKYRRIYKTNWNSSADSLDSGPILNNLEINLKCTVIQTIEALENQWLTFCMPTYSKGQLISKPKKETNEFVLLSWQLRNTLNLNFYFKFQVFPSRQDRKTNSLVHFLGEVTAWQFCFKIYWSLETP